MTTVLQESLQQKHRFNGVTEDGAAGSAAPRPRPTSAPFSLRDVVSLMRPSAAHLPRGVLGTAPSSAFVYLSGPLRRRKHFIRCAKSAQSWGPSGRAVVRRRRINAETGVLYE
ncbi:hypothetical protein EVAR_12056_1 [Eumeta japonica]|uniref:Uncharacterized protein n=1 Tax=Eumeta variegata TaxID=151549 RepID=A0A4C1U4Y3_EUMVA|nr:hypothetical protein EVAR_12056_1 [Eumeta japonica]